MVAVDTNLLVRIVIRDDEDQARVADHYIEKGAWVSHLVLVESVWVLRTAFGFDARKLAETVEMVLGHEHFVLQDPEVVRAALELYRDRPSLGFSDCMILEIARKAGHLPLGTFDRNLGRVEGAERL